MLTKQDGIDPVDFVKITAADDANVMGVGCLRLKKGVHDRGVVIRLTKSDAVKAWIDT